MRRQAFLFRASVIALCLPFVQCVWRRTVTTRPAVTVVVVDAAGAPVAGAEVVIVWWSYPHRRVHDRYVVTSGADGRAVFAGASRRETIAPLCMHGVPQHEHSVCVDVPGKGHGEVELERSGEVVTIALEPGPADGRCAELARERAGAPAPGAQRAE
ncbi:MAG: hypothetical protein K8M05_16905 [Deltaproteobacteria bacterium]|nr:hypothetical protein [Kofleriaceae bacterium]